jgi:hypothetical protein
VTLSEPKEELPSQTLPPWQKPGAVPRDCAPHRGPLIRLLGTVSIITGGLALFCGLTAPLALLTGVAAVVLAGRDLRQMVAGRMDPQGAEGTWAGQHRGETGIMFAAGWGLFWVFVWGYDYSHTCHLRLRRPPPSVQFQLDSSYPGSKGIPVNYLAPHEETKGVELQGTAP